MLPENSSYRAETLLTESKNGVKRIPKSVGKQSFLNVSNKKSTILMSPPLSNLSKSSNNSRLCVSTAENSLWSLVWLLILNGLKCVFFAMIRPRLWPSPGLVLAITLSDASFNRKVGVKKIWNPPTL